MAFKNVNDMYTIMKNKGLKRTQEFQLQIGGSGISSVDRALENLTIFATGAQVPGRTQNFTDIQVYGFPLNTPTNMTMTNELTLTIRCESDLLIRDAMLVWMATITDPAIEEGSAMGGVKTASSAEGNLDLLAQDMETITHTFTLVGLYPTNVGEIELSHEDPNIATFSATFKYQFWKESTPNRF